MTTLQTTFDEKNQHDRWQNKVAKRLNHLIARAHFVNSDPLIQKIDKCFILSVLSIVERVRVFEEIKTIEELKPQKYPRQKITKP